MNKVENMKEIRNKLYRVYNHIVFRCNNELCEHYDRYGARGIQNLLGTFDEFFNHMIDSYIEHVSVHGYSNTTIDRIDNNGHYSYDNIKWSTRKEQAINRCTTKYYRVINTLDNEEYFINNAVGFCNRVNISWSSFNYYLDTNKNVNNFIIESIDIGNIDLVKLNQICATSWSKPIKIQVYRILGIGVDITVANLKDWCRKNGVDPSAAYKCVKGKRNTAGGYTFINTVVEV